MKTITINNSEIKIACNALTYMYYRKIFDKDIFDDIDAVRDFLVLHLSADNLNIENKTRENIIPKLNAYIEALNRLTYVAIYTNNQDIEDYVKWIKSNNILEQESNCTATIIEEIIDCFIDGKVHEELKKLNESSGDDTEVLFPEHFFLSACLRLGLTLENLKILTYIDVMKIFLSTTREKKERKKVKKATQADWDRLAGR